MLTLHVLFQPLLLYMGNSSARINPLPPVLLEESSSQQGYTSWWLCQSSRYGTAVHFKCVSSLSEGMLYTTIHTLHNIQSSQSTLTLAPAPQLGFNVWTGTWNMFHVLYSTIHTVHNMQSSQRTLALSPSWALMCGLGPGTCSVESSLSCSAALDNSVSRKLRYWTLLFLVHYWHGPEFLPGPAADEPGGHCGQPHQPGGAGGGATLVTLQWFAFSTNSDCSALS